MLDAKVVRDVIRDTVVSRRFGYAYIPVGKAANTNVKRWLWEQEHANGFLLPTPSKYFEVHNYQWRFTRADNETPWLGFERHEVARFFDLLQTSFVFTVVRNPYSRLLSAYRDKIASQTKKGIRQPKLFGLPRMPSDFSEFVAMVCEMPDAELDIHFRSQTYSTIFDYLRLDRIGYVETLDRDVIDLQSRIFNAKLGDRLSTESIHRTDSTKSLTEFMTPETVTAILERFRGDFLNFGYSESIDHLAPVGNVRMAGSRSDELRRYVSSATPRATVDLAVHQRKIHSSAPKIAISTRKGNGMCILHIGMHKTGTTSIQESLFANLKDEKFCYVNTGKANINRTIFALFSKNSASRALEFKKLGLTTAEVTSLKEKYRNLFDSALSSVAGRTAIISAESISMLSAKEVEDLGQYLKSFFSDVRVVAYVRPPLQYAESIFQQRLKAGALNLRTAGLFPQYRNRFEHYDRIFGREKVSFWRFDSASFHSGDVVHDFCSRVGIDSSEIPIVRANERLSLCAMKLLYIYRKFGPGFGIGRDAVISNRKLVRTLAKLSGPKFQMHPLLISPTVKENKEQLAWMENRIGCFLDDTNAQGDPSAIKSLDDLLLHDHATIAWLSERIGMTLEDQTGITTKEIADWMHELRLSTIAADRSLATGVT